MQTSGIYRLTYKDGSYYIGQSVRLEQRKKEHYRDLLNENHPNYQVQQKFNYLRVLPEFTVVSYCTIENLNSEEDKLIDITDPLCLNLKTGQSSNYGSNAITAKYETIDIELAFLILVDNPGISHKEVANFVGIDINTVHDISAGRNRAFTEMKKLYPEKYEKLLKQKAANTRGKYTVRIKHTDGRLVELKSGEYSAFCKENNVQVSNLSKVINGTRNSTMGWTLVDKNENI
jgi:hypothetical protein